VEVPLAARSLHLPTEPEMKGAFGDMRLPHRAIVRHDDSMFGLSLARSTPSSIIAPTANSPTQSTPHLAPLAAMAVMSGLAIRENLQRSLHGDSRQDHRRDRDVV